MSSWKIGIVQMDAQLGELGKNLESVCAKLRRAAGLGARLIIFPECILTGYAFDSLDEAISVAETIPGPATQRLSDACRELGCFTVVGGLEREGGRVFNVAMLVGPNGLISVYRKIHLPFLGVDRFTTPGDRPFGVQDLGGLRVGMNICYDGSFPESTRVLALLGADLVVLPTNWPSGAESTVQHMVQCRAIENHVFYAAVNRVGTERGSRFIGQSRIVNLNGDLLASASETEEQILTSDIDPERSRNKQIVRVPGKYMLHRTRDRRPDMYGPIIDQNRLNDGSA